MTDQFGMMAQSPLQEGAAPAGRLEPWPGGSAPMTVDVLYNPSLQSVDFVVGG
jgi:hypothetical protein